MHDINEDPPHVGFEPTTSNQQASILPQHHGRSCLTAELLGKLSEIMNSCQENVAPSDTYQPSTCAGTRESLNCLQARLCHLPSLPTSCAASNLI